MLKINNLTKLYGSFRALDNLCLEIPTGSVYGFVGPNGAGKTTTMKIIAGLLKADSGEIYVDDVNIINNKDFICEKVGYMPDFFGVYDNLKVIEYLDFYADTYYLPEKGRVEKFDYLLNLVNLEDKKDFYVDDLSRGMKQRLCLARSIIHEPEVVILDEPASGLDPRARAEMKLILKRLNEMGKTIIISSHILPELQEMCTHIGIMEKGRMINTANELQENNFKKYVVKVIDNANELVKLLESNEFVSNVSVENNTAVFDMVDNIEMAGKLLKELCAKDISVVFFGEKEISLEETFLQVTGGAVND